MAADQGTTLVIGIPPLDTDDERKKSVIPRSVYFQTCRLWQLLPSCTVWLLLPSCTLRLDWLCHRLWLDFCLTIHCNFTASDVHFDWTIPGMRFDFCNTLWLKNSYSALLLDCFYLTIQWLWLLLLNYVVWLDCSYLTIHRLWLLLPNYAVWFDCSYELYTDFDCSYLIMQCDLTAPT